MNRVPPAASGAEGELPVPPRRRPPGRLASSLALAFLTALAAVATETAVCAQTLGHRLPDIAMVYLLGVVVMAMRFGHAPSLFTAGLSVAAFDFFFTVPYFSFAVEDKRYVLTFVIMFSVAFAISNRTESIRRSASAARRRETRTARLYAMSRELAVARSSDEVIDAALSHLRDAFASDIGVLLLEGDGSFRRAGSSREELAPDVEFAARSMCAEGARAAGLSVVLDRGTRLVPLRASTGNVGVLVVQPGMAERFASRSHEDLFDTFASQIALAIERARLGEDAQRAQLEVQKERLRNALLSTVSHDLRTPLAVIKGAVTALMESQTAAPASRRVEYLTTISEEASRLDRLVRNLLDMTSLEAGSLRVRNKEWQSIEEVIGVALNRLEEQLGNRPVVVRIPVDAAMVPFDATLVGQVIINLVENAIKYTPPDAAIEINARRVDQGVEVEVADSGPGVPEGQEEAIFEKFHRAVHTSRGMGIGLAICRGMVVAHGGRIWYEHRKPGGSSFRFVLPRDADGPPMDGLPEVSGDP